MLSQSVRLYAHVLTAAVQSDCFDELGGRHALCAECYHRNPGGEGAGWIQENTEQQRRVDVWGVGG